MGGLFSSEPVKYPQYNYDNSSAYSPSRTTHANQYSSGGTLSSPRRDGYSNGIRSSDKLDFLYNSNTYSSGQPHFSGGTANSAGCYSNSRTIGIRSSNCLDYDYNSHSHSSGQRHGHSSNTYSSRQPHFSSGTVNSAGCYSSSRSIGIRSSDCLHYDYNSYSYSSGQRISNTPRIHLSKVVASKLNWTNQDCEVLKVLLQSTDAEYLQILNLFYKTTNKKNHVIKHIERVQNPYLMGRYEMKKSELKKRAGFVAERLLFHGTKDQYITSICQDNLNWRMHGKGTGHRFGQGVSFSPKSYYSSFYCDKKTHNKVMIVAKVMIAHQIVGDGNMVIPPYMNSYSKIGYDTSVKEDGSVIVKYCDDEFYPAYVIHFHAKTLNVRKRNTFNQVLI